MVRSRQSQKQDKIQLSKSKLSQGRASATTGADDPRLSFTSLIKHGIVVVIIGGAALFAAKGYLETRINTPFDDNKVITKSGLMVPDLYWGSYRPGNYFGLKTREPYSPVVGLMWYFPSKIDSGSINIRHWCEQGDHLKRYTWTKHDGKSFGVQEIDDMGVRLTTSFLKRLGGDHGGDWTSRITVNSLGKISEEPVTLVFYTAMDANAKGKLAVQPGKLVSFIGQTEKLGDFSIHLKNIGGQIEYSSYLVTEGKGLHLLKELVMSNLRYKYVGGVKTISFPGDISKRSPANFTAIQVTGIPPFEVDLVFESGSYSDRPNMLVGEVYTGLLEVKIKEFDTKFEDIFRLKERAHSEEEVNFAQTALSNLLGGIGYFYGSSRVMSDRLEQPVSYWKAPLYTSVPSRSFFPRGFLWDEGFHGLLIATWDIDIELDIMSHWFDLMNIEGWIPREQILGLEALAKVPAEFVTQMNSNANPPTFLLTLSYIINSSPNITESNLRVFERLYRRVVKWFDWYNTTQTGELPGSYRWRGRDGNTDLELNPKTLTSGLDDYPRASHPTSDERHVDLLCWIILSAQVLSELSALLLRTDDSHKYSNTYYYLSNNQLLDQLHWSYKTDTYADYGLHTDDVLLGQTPPKTRQHGHLSPQPFRRLVLKSPEPQFVDSNFGYVSLFPFFLQVIDPESEKLQIVLKNLENTNYLWTDYGLRSLAKTSPIYMKRNTEHDPPYWRGPIWINMNYLALRALNFYSERGSYRDLASSIYIKLRRNIIKNMLKEYKRSGYIWEQYDDKTGKGQGSHPFTGWSSLIVLIMGEIY